MQSGTKRSLAAAVKVRDLSPDPLSDDAAPESATQEKPNRNRARRLLLIGFTLLILLAAAGFGGQWLLVGRYLVSTEDAYLQADSAVVGVKVAGYIAEVAVTDNQLVSAGQPLVRIDDRDYRAELAEAEADVAAAAAEQRNVEAQILQQNARLAQGDAELASAGAQADYATEESSRYKGLIDSGAVSVQKARSAETDVRRLAAGVAESKAALDAARGQLAVLQAQKEKAVAALQRAEATREQAQLRLSYSVVVAPVDGVVGDRSVRVGQYVQTGGRLMTIVPIHDIYVIANFKETQLDGLFHGEQVKIVLDGYPDLSVEGTIDSVAPGTGATFALLPPENATGNFTKIVQRVPVKIRIDPATLGGFELRPGLSVTATVDTRTVPPGPRTTLVSAVGRKSP